MNNKDFLDKDVLAEDLKIEKIKELGIDPEDWKVTNLEIELEKNISESVSKDQLHMYLRPVIKT